MAKQPLTDGAGRAAISSYVEDLYNAALVERVFEDSSIPTSKLVGGDNLFIVGVVQMFAGSTAPTGWRFCNGDVLNIVDAPDLFAVISNAFGGNGITTFAVPDLRGRAPIGVGTGSGLTARALAATVGGESSTLTTTELPAHTHSFNASSVPADQVAPSSVRALATEPSGLTAFYKEVAPDTALISSTIGSAGTGDPFTNMQPSLAINFIIAVSA